MHDVLAIGEEFEVHQTSVEPFRVGLGLGERRLDLRILHDPTRSRVHEKHVPRLEPALARDGRRIEIEDTRLGGEDDEAIVGHPEASRAQAIAIKDRADQSAIREGHVGRAVPGFHHRGVVLVEGSSRRIHVDVVLPRLRDHHEHRVGQ